MKVEVISYQTGKIDVLEEFGENLVNSMNQVYTKMELLRMLDIKLEAAKQIQEKFIKFRALQKGLGK